jgi:Fe-S cluster biogenesis protein NfuA
MSIELQSIVISKTAEGGWLAHHVPSGRKIEAESKEEAEQAMREALGLNDRGQLDEPLTSTRFTGVAQAIALFLEGPVSEALAFHAGFARLEAYDGAVAHIRLGGGCQGCPSSQITLFNGVRTQLQNRFGQDVVAEVIPALDY